MTTILQYKDYTVAWIAVLPIEAAACLGMLDKQHKGYFPTSWNYDATFIGGEVNGHNVVVATWPAGQNYGIGSAAALASQIKARFENLRVTLLVGVAAGIPNLTPTAPQQKRDIRLGDVLVALPDKTSTGVVQYDLGSYTESGFHVNGRQAETTAIVRSAIGHLRLRSPDPFREGNELAGFLAKFLEKPEHERFRYPGPEDNSRSRSPDSSINSRNSTTNSTMIQPSRIESHLPRVWYGNLGSGNSLVRSAQYRDQLRDQYNLIGLEMEAAGIMNVLPAGVIRGVSDYGDDQKTKKWQPYAAAVAAAYAKGILYTIQPHRVLPGLVDRSDGKSHTLPFPRNDDFVPREHALLSIERLLPPTNSGQRAALWGLGGCGKTQLALEWAYRRHTDLGWSVFWVHGGDTTEFSHGYRQIAKVAGLSEDLQGEDLLFAVRSWLERHTDWVLVIDSADDLRIFGLPSAAANLPQMNLSRYLPLGSCGSTLWTTRDEKVLGHLVGMKRGINVVGMTESEAIEMLSSHCGLSDLGVDVAAAVVDQLNRMPLAISSAASYIRETGSSMKSYLDMLQSEKRRGRLLAVEGTNFFRRAGVPNNVISTWIVTVEHLRAECRLAFIALQICSFFHDQNIPEELIKRSLQRPRMICQARTESNTESEREDEQDKINVAIQRLCQFSFLQKQITRNGEVSFDVHKLVHEAIRSFGRNTSQAMKEDFESAAHTALEVIANNFPSGEADTWSLCDRYLHHALAVLSWQETRPHRRLLALLSINVGRFLLRRGRPNEAECILEQALRLRRDLLGNTHLDTLQATAGLASAYEALGRYEEAEKMFKQVLELRQAMLGHRHPDTIRTLSDVATTYHLQGRYDDAERLFEQAYQLHKEILGDNHIDAIRAGYKIATLYIDRGRYGEAEQLSNRMFALSESTFGDTHPLTLSLTGQLAAIYLKRGMLDRSESITSQYLGKITDILGDQHPDAISMIAHLAEIYSIQERYDEAEPLAYRALLSRRNALGDLHPLTIWTFRFMGQIYKHQDRGAEARDMFELADKSDADRQRLDHNDMVEESGSHSNVTSQ